MLAGSCAPPAAPRLACPLVGCAPSLPTPDDPACLRLNGLGSRMRCRRFTTPTALLPQRLLEALTHVRQPPQDSALLGGCSVLAEAAGRCPCGHTRPAPDSHADLALTGSPCAIERPTNSPPPLRFGP